ncbi:MAG: tyrosine-type recombinase/integrase [Acidimicrobiales bacterium]
MRTGLAVDKDVVLDIPQAFALADRCAKVGSWGGVVTCYVLVMALCGLRPNEAVGLLWEDVELAQDSSPGWLTVRRSRRRVAPRWLDPDEDPEWGPLKDREIVETRRVPIHPLLVNRLREHRRSFGIGPGGLVFHRRDRPFDLTLFGREVWEPARASMFPPRTDMPPDDPRQPKLSRLRRHDLRHAACSWWLREGVDATVCQRWSGHKSLSVFLDVYQGVAPGREEDGVRKLVTSLSGAGDFPPSS